MIAQLGKNYSLPKNKRIPGNILLGFALMKKPGNFTLKEIYDWFSA